MSFDGVDIDWGISCFQAEWRESNIGLGQTEFYSSFEDLVQSLMRRGQRMEKDICLLLLLQQAALPLQTQSPINTINIWILSTS
jgi:hypothetical protein